MFFSGREGAASKCIFFTKNPNLKKKIFKWGGSWWGWDYRVSEFFYKESKSKKKKYFFFGGGGGRGWLVGCYRVSEFFYKQYKSKNTKNIFFGGGGGGGGGVSEGEGYRVSDLFLIIYFFRGERGCQ